MNLSPSCQCKSKEHNPELKFETVAGCTKQRQRKKKSEVLKRNMISNMKIEEGPDSVQKKEEGPITFSLCKLQLK